MTFYLDPPTEPQEAFIASLCDQHGLTPPAVIASKQEATRIIDEIRANTYNPEDYLYPFRVGARLTVLDDRDEHAEQVWHHRYDGTEDVQR